MRRIKIAGFTVSGLMLAGIGTLMILSAGKNEDITGIVAPAVLIAVISGATGAAATFLEKRNQRD